jgi:sec-independent protein translocase protein TatC
MATAVRTIAYDDRLSLVEHLDELRTRLIVCAAALIVAFGFCAWQNGAILDLVNVPLEKTAFKEKGKSTDPFERQAAFQQQSKRTFLAQEKIFLRLAAGAESADIAGNYRNLARSARALANTVPPRQAKKPVTLGVGEPFTQTIKLASYAALLLALPLILYQMYAFILPAFSPREKRVALPLMLAVPFLFGAGVLFAYFAILPSAVDFLQNFNDDEYDILLQARDYYKFAITVLIAMGLAFQVPVGILAVTRVGIVSIDRLRRTRRYAILVIAVLAMVLPGQDPVTMLMMMIPLYLLYEGSILVAAVLDRRATRAAEREEAEMADDDDRY